MAELKFTAASAKDSVYAAEVEQAASIEGVSVTAKGVVNLEETTGLGDGVSTIDVSGSAFFKNVSVAAGNKDQLVIKGNGTVANTFYAGAGGSTLFGGSGVLDTVKSKIVTAADKIYGGSGADVFVYEANAGKDVIYNYGDGDVVRLDGFNSETQSLSFVDKNGGLTVTISDSDDTTVAKNSVLTIDGKSASAVGGKFTLEFVDSKGEVTNSFVYGQTIEGAADYAVNARNNKVDASTLLVKNAAEYAEKTGAEEGAPINTAIISSGIKNITVTDSDSAVYVIGNGNANAITIGSMGGTIDGGTGAKATADKLFGTASAPVTFVFDAKTGGKDQIGDAKLTQYNYKASDQIVLTNGTEVASIYAKGSDVMVSIDSNNLLTIKNGLGKPINIVDEESDFVKGHDKTTGSDTTISIENWGDTLPTGLNYDSDKFSKVTADDAVITAGEFETVISWGEPYQDENGKWHQDGETTASYPTIALDESATYASSVKEIDLSTSSAPVVVDTSSHASVTVVKVGKSGGTVTGYSADPVAQTFTAGDGKDFFTFNVEKIEAATGESEDATARNNALKKFKGDSIIGLGKGDSISIVGLNEETDLTGAESGKDFVVKVDDTTLFTIKNYDSETGATLLGDDGYVKTYGVPAMPDGLSYADKKGKVDKSGLVAGTFSEGDTSLHGVAGTFDGTAIAAADYGDAAIKTINATAVTESESLEIVGSSAANIIYAPTSGIDATLNGLTGNDNLYGSDSDTGGQITFVFEANAAKGKKDVIYNYKEGDIILINQDELIEASLDASFGTETDENDVEHGTLQYNTGKVSSNDKPVMADGFNDSKSDVVITLNKSNTITVKNGAGKQIILADGDLENTYSFGHIAPTGLAYDAKNTTVSLKAGASYEGDVDLMNTSVYYTTMKKVDLSGNTVAANIYGNTIANELIGGAGGGILDGGSVYEKTDAKGKQIKPTADKLTGGGNGTDIFVYDVGYGKDSFLNFGEGDIVSLGAGITAANLSIVDKKNVLTVSIVDPSGALFEDPRGEKTKDSPKTAANSTFTITKTSDNVAVTFIGEGLLVEDGDNYDEDNGKFVYGDLTGLTMDAKYATLTADASVEAGTVINMGTINSTPKVLDGKAVTGGTVLIGNANADAIYGGGTADGAGSTLFGGTAGTKAVKDQLYGSDGTDYFLFTTQDGTKGKETDIVYNYQAGDVIVLDRAPDLVKADGKAIALTFNDSVTSGTKTTVVPSTLTINGMPNEKGKYDTFSASTPVTFAITKGFLDEYGNIDLGELETESYTFNPGASGSTLKSGKAVWGKDAGMKEYTGEPDPEPEPETTEGGENGQYAAVDGWFNEVVSTDNASVSELDSILDVKGALNGEIAALDGDAFFTNTSFESKAAAITGARHRSKK